MAPRRTTRAGPAPETTTTTTSVINAELQAMIDQGVIAALAARDANRNGDDSHASGMSVRGNEYAARECTYPDFLKCKPLNFKGTEGVVKGTDVVTYNQGFQELALRCDRMFSKESKKVEKYVSGLPNMIHDTENKRKLDNNNQAQQRLPKRQNMAQAYAAGTGKRKGYAGTLTLCNKCKFHHNDPYTVKCTNCNRGGHLTRDCWSSAATNNQRTLTCYECRNQGYYKSDCPELKNGNQAGGVGTRGMVLALVGGEPNQDLDDMEDNTNA
ncbi:putative ribonuclease H-like domain-containing protein [Tanacetum coccineum]|uniref:Ribonuclease H-like domain-containing protein n=1 Tax=Tanacetum coccineum TaxID=301880 RepID=A0ABQ4XZD6_9ASTR